MDGVRRMKGLVLEERKARQVSTKSKVMSMSVSNSKQEHWKEGNCRVSAGVLATGLHGSERQGEVSGGRV